MIKQQVNFFIILTKFVQLHYLFYLIGDNSRAKSTPPLLNRPLSTERKSIMEDKFNQLVQEKSSKDIMDLTHSLSTTNEETTSSFSGWDDPSIALLSTNNEVQHEPTKQTSASPIVDCYYPTLPSDLSFTVNMTVADSKSSTATGISQKQQQQQQQKQELTNFRSQRFNLAHKLIAETSESEMSMNHESWTQNCVYQSKDHHPTGLSSSYNNLSK